MANQTQQSTLSLATAYKMEPKMTIPTRVSALTLAAVLAFGAAAQAQAPPPPPPGANAAGPPQPGPPDPRQDRAAREAQRVAALHQALNIKPDQEQAFNAFAATMRPPGAGWKSSANRPSRQALAAMTTPQRLDAMSQMMDARISQMKERFQARSTATKALYAELGPDQRRTMDALPDLMGRRGGMGRGPHGGMDGRPGMGPPRSGVGE